MTKWFGNFLFSENRNEYIRIAFEYNSTPWRVYNLAHRSKARSRKEERILMELKERGIITVIRLFWSKRITKRVGPFSLYSSSQVFDMPTLFGNLHKTFIKRDLIRRSFKIVLRIIIPILKTYLNFARHYFEKRT